MFLLFAFKQQLCSQLNTVRAVIKEKQALWISGS
jgi:hypothetical protein